MPLSPYFCIHRTLSKYTGKENKKKLVVSNWNTWNHVVAGICIVNTNDLSATVFEAEIV